MTKSLALIFPSSAFHGVATMYPKREFLSDDDDVEKESKVSERDFTLINTIKVNIILTLLGSVEDSV